MTAPSHDSVVRETQEFTGSDGESKVTAHVVTDETKGTVMSVDGPRNVFPGDVLVPTERGDVYHVMPPGAMDDYKSGDSESTPEDSGTDTTIPTSRDTDSTDTGETGKADNSSADRDDSDLDNAADYDPSDYSATKVRQYVSRLVEAGRTDDAQRIVNDEREDKDRKTAIPQNYQDWENEQSENGSGKEFHGIVE